MPKSDFKKKRYSSGEDTIDQTFLTISLAASKKKNDNFSADVCSNIYWRMVLVYVYIKEIRSEILEIFPCSRDPEIFGSLRRIVEYKTFSRRREKIACLLGFC